MVFHGKNMNDEFWVNVAQITSVSGMIKIDEQNSAFDIHLTDARQERYCGPHKDAEDAHANLIFLMQK